MRMMAVAAISLAGCCLVSPREMDWEAIFPLEVGPEIAVARFRAAVTLGQTDIAYGCLTPQTRKKMDRTRFEMALATNYEVEYEGHKIPLRDFICSAKLVDVDRYAHHAEILLEWGRMWVTILARRIGKRWYLALVESLRGWK